MSMVALDAPRTKVVPTGSIEARWMVNEGDASDYIKEARKAPKMQELMTQEAAGRLEAEKESAKVAAADKARRQVA